MDEPPSTGPLAAVILAAGQGTRMRSSRHKVLHHLAGRPLISRVVDVVKGAGAAYVAVVVGHQADQVRRALADGIDTIVQEPQLGTGHAVQVTADHVRRSGAACLLVQLADNALIRPSSLQRLIDVGVDSNAPVTLLTARLRDPRGYGRVHRGPDGSVVYTVEEVDATPQQRAIDEIWAGSMLLWTDWLWNALERLPVSPKGEYYLPELVNLANLQGLKVRAAQTDSEDEAYGINDRAQLARANAIVRRRVLDQLMREGVTIVDPATTYIDPEVQVDGDAVIQPGCHLQGRSRVGRDSEIGPSTMLVDAEVGIGSRVWMSVLEGATVGDRVNIGPFSHLRPGAIVEDDANLGNYAEVKASRIGAGTQMHHFSYVGDAEIGRDVNIGAGTITANFDSESRDKSPTVVGDHASIGSHTVLVAPVNVGADAITGAGSVVTHDIPPGEVWLGAPARRFRERQQPSGTDPA